MLLVFGIMLSSGVAFGGTVAGLCIQQLLVGGS